MKKSKLFHCNKFFSFCPQPHQNILYLKNHYLFYWPKKKLEFIFLKHLKVHVVSTMMSSTVCCSSKTSSGAQCGNRIRPECTENNHHQCLRQDNPQSNPRRNHVGRPNFHNGWRNGFHCQHTMSKSNRTKQTDVFTLQHKGGAAVDDFGHWYNVDGEFIRAKSCVVDLGQQFACWIQAPTRRRPIVSEKKDKRMIEQWYKDLEWGFIRKKFVSKTVIITISVLKKFWFHFFKLSGKCGNEYQKHWPIIKMCTIFPLRSWQKHLRNFHLTRSSHCWKNGPFPKISTGP